MPEKLMTIREASGLLGLSEGKVKELVEKGELPAYKIGGQYLRFRREQIEAIRDEIPAKITVRSLEAAPKEYLKKRDDVAYAQSLSDRLFDLFYFNDFYIISAVLILLILWVIFGQ